MFRIISRRQIVGSGWLEMVSLYPINTHLIILNYFCFMTEEERCHTSDVQITTGSSIDTNLCCQILLILGWLFNISQGWKMEYPLVKILVNIKGNLARCWKIHIRIKMCFSAIWFRDIFFENTSLPICLRIPFHLSTLTVAQKVRL